MNAPDKIYINNYNGNDTFGNQWHTKPSESPSVVSHEYIRKDFLIEWAKSKKATLKQGYKHEWKNDDVLHGGTLILDSLIEKIESL